PRGRRTRAMSRSTDLSLVDQVSNRHPDLSVVPDEPTRARRYAGSIWLGLASLGVVLVIILLVSIQGSPTPAPPPIVVVSTPYWNVPHATESVLAQHGDVTEASPSIYAIDAAGDVTNQYAPDAAA